MDNTDKVTFGQFAKRWLVEVASVRMKPTGLREYKALFHRHVLPFLGNQLIDHISPEDIQQYVHLKIEAGLSPRSVRNHLAVIRAVLTTAERWGVVETNVAMKVASPREQRVEQRFLSPSEMKAVLDATAASWRLLTALPMYTGARKGECLALRWPYVRVADRQIAFVSSMRSGVESEVKTPASRASVAMAEELVALFEERRTKVANPIAGYVFCDREGEPLGDSTPNKVLRRACVKAGIEPCGFHTLRHSAIAALIATGAHVKVVQQFARHASVETTMDVYGHLLHPAGSDAVADLGRLIDGS